MGDPRTKHQLMVAAAECGNLIHSIGNGFKAGVLSLQWVDSFMQRHPTVSFRTPESITRDSANESQNNIINFIENTGEQLKEFLKENFEPLLRDPTAWGNSDETNFELNPVPSKVLTKKGGKNVYRVESAKPKEKISVMHTLFFFSYPG